MGGRGWKMGKRSRERGAEKREESEKSGKCEKCEKCGKSEKREEKRERREKGEKRSEEERTGRRDCGIFACIRCGHEVLSSTVCAWER